MYIPRYVGIYSNIANINYTSRYSLIARLIFFCVVINHDMISMSHVYNNNLRGLKFNVFFFVMNTYR